MRMTHTREFYVPSNATKVEAEGVNAEIYVYERSSVFLMIAFVGRAQKPTVHYRFSTIEKRAAYVTQFIADQTKLAARKTERKQAAKAERAKPHSLVVGDILSSSWGYEQTNVDFYQVVEVVSEHTVRIRPIGQSSEETGWMQGTCMGVKDSFSGEKVLTKRCGPDNSIKLTSFSWARKWDGRPMHWTAYA